MLSALIGKARACRRMETMRRALHSSTRRAITELAAGRGAVNGVAEKVSNAYAKPDPRCTRPPRRCKEQSRADQRLLCERNTIDLHVERPNHPAVQMKMRRVCMRRNTRVDHMIAAK